jgi:hypothetical protein
MCFCLRRAQTRRDAGPWVEEPASLGKAAAGRGCALDAPTARDLPLLEIAPGPGGEPRTWHRFLEDPAPRNLGQSPSSVETSESRAFGGTGLP